MPAERREPMKWRLMMAAAAAATAMAAGPVQAQDDMADVEIGVTDLGDGLYLLTGRGGNMGLSVGEDATFLIDDQFAPLTPKIRAAIAELTDQPVKFVFNTHWHFDHVGGNENFGETGSVIVAHDNVRERMSKDQFLEAFNREVPASPPEALPVVTFNDRVTFHLNGETIRAFHTPHAHTDGDSVIHFDGVIEAANAVLAMTDEESVIIPGHGPIADRDDLRAYRDMLATVRDSINAMIADGMSLEQVQAANPTADFDAVHNEMGMFEPAQWVGLLYGLLAPAEGAGEE